MARQPVILRDNRHVDLVESSNAPCADEATVGGSVGSCHRCEQHELTSSSTYRTPTLHLLHTTTTAFPSTFDLRFLERPSQNHLACNTRTIEARKKDISDDHFSNSHLFPIGNIFALFLYPKSIPHPSSPYEHPFPFQYARNQAVSASRAFRL